MRKIRLGELGAHVTGGVDGQGGGDGPIVILLHGFGAPGGDLVGLAGELGVQSSVRFVFPMAPMALEAGPDDSVGRAWWMIDMAALQVAALTRNIEALAQREPTGLSEARDAVDTLLDALPGELGAGPLLLGGFSQGAMLASDTLLRSERAFAGLMVLSGIGIAETHWLRHAPARAGMPVFQSHGTEDPILPFAAAERLKAQLVAAGLAVEWLPFRGGHAIPRAVLSGLGGFIKRHGNVAP